MTPMKDETPKTLPFSLYFGENQFPIAVRRMAGGGRPVPVHGHEFSELVIVTKGWVEHRIGGETERIAETLGQDYFILPSSIHECLILPDDGTYERGELERMVREINRRELLPQEVLSDRVYHYDRALAVLA